MLTDISKKCTGIETNYADCSERLEKSRFEFCPTGGAYRYDETASLKYAPIFRPVNILKKVVLKDSGMT